MIYFLIMVIGICSLIMPWWSMALICFSAGLNCETLRKAAVSGFFSVFIVWVVFSYYFDAKALGLVSKKVAVLLHLPFPAMAYIVTGFVGGLIGLSFMVSGYYYTKAFSGWTGRIFTKRVKKHII